MRLVTLTPIFAIPLTPGELNFIEFYVGSTCRLSSQNGIEIGIFREHDQGTQGICSYELVTTVTLSKAKINSLLGGRTSGLVHVSGLQLLLPIVIFSK